MNWKFWKKDDYSFGGNDAFSGNLGLPPSATSSSGGLDLSGGYEAGGAGLGNSAAPNPFSAPSAPSLPPLSQGMNGMNDAHPLGSNNFNQLPPAPSQFSNMNAYTHDDHDEAPSGHTSGSTPVGKDIEIVSAKLDAIKSQLDMLNLRLGTIEQRLASQQEQPGGPRKPWY